MSDVALPHVGGFVCDSQSSVEWVSTVERVWTAYYRARSTSGSGYVGLDAVRDACCEASVGIVSSFGCSKCGCCRLESYADFPSLRKEHVSAGRSGGPFSFEGSCGDERVGGVVSECSSGSSKESVSAARGDGAADLDGGRFHTGVSGVVVDGSVRGSNYWRNKRKRDNKKRKMQSNWRSGFERQKEDAESDTTVVTVDTKSAEEIQAKRSLAVRRTMENKVATALAAHKLRALKDKTRTDAVEKLAAARFEQRINEAKAKSQSSFKQCDQSLKSLGSSGSAGEFALKQEVKRAQDDRKLLDYVQKQLDIAIKCATPAAIAAINALPAPEFQDEFEAFGDCPSDYDEDEAQAYYNQLNARNQELADIANVGF